MNEQSAIQIVVMQRGNIIVGYTSYDPATDRIVITQGSVIRVWGTTKGLGELRNGPTDQTKLDPIGTVRVPVHAEIFSVDVNASAWADVLGD